LDILSVMLAQLCEGKTQSEAYYRALLFTSMAVQRVRFDSGVSPMAVCMSEVFWSPSEDRPVMPPVHPKGTASWLWMPGDVAPLDEAALCTQWP